MRVNNNNNIAIVVVVAVIMIFIWWWHTTTTGGGVTESMATGCNRDDPRNSYVPGIWNNDSANRKHNNCYTYGINYLDDNAMEKPYPGYYSGFERPTSYDCGDLKRRMYSDIKGLYEIGVGDECDCDHHKMMMFIDDIGAKIDFHFYRENAPNKWSHKLGPYDVTDVDSKGNAITNPLTAVRDYRDDPTDERSGFNYEKPCGVFCVPLDKHLG